MHHSRKRALATIGRGTLATLVAASAVTAAIAADVWVLHHPHQVKASGDSLAAIALVAGLLALVATERLLTLATDPLTDRLSDLAGTSLKAQVLAHLEGQSAHAADISEATGATYNEIYWLLVELEQSGKVTAYWTPGTPRIRMYALAASA